LQTLAVAQNASNSPIPVRCHGCLERSPAWIGIHRFVVQQRPLLEIMRESDQYGVSGSTDR
jgi:hypothetical protein